jgi:Kef-type K+ transport system membrane component KefB
MVSLFSAYLAEVFGLHAVIGAFIGGALLSNVPFAKIEDVQRKVSGPMGYLFPYSLYLSGYLKMLGLF